MGGITLLAFSGEQPRVIARLLPENGAQDARNLRLDDGGLTPIRESVFEQAVAISDAQTIYRHQGAWLAWPTVVSAAPGPVASDRLYFTGDGVPKLRVSGTDYGLAVPRPGSALTATPSGGGSSDVSTRLYTWTWVTGFGEESEPADASVAIDWQSGETVTLSGFEAPPAGRNITKQRIYRSQTGQSGTGFFFIAERDADATDFVDDVAIDAFAEALPSIDWTAPPDGLTGLIALPNGMMAAFQGRDLYFCEPFHPHAWPEKYVLTADFDIVALGAVGTSLIVTTTGNPYLVAGTQPETMQMVKLEINLPCINARGLVDLGIAIAYPSHEGLVLARADGSINLVTGNLFNRDGWLKLAPETMIGAQERGRYIAFYEQTDGQGGTLIIDVSGQVSFLIRAAPKAAAAFYAIEDGALYYLEPASTRVMRYDSPVGVRTMAKWRSKQWALPFAENFGAILVEAQSSLSDDERATLDANRTIVEADNAALIAADQIAADISAAAIGEIAIAGDLTADLPVNPEDVTVVMIADGKPRATVKALGKPTRLPSGFKARIWEVAVSTNLRIEEIRIAKTMDELRAAV